MDSSSLSSAPYLSNDEGVVILKEAISAVKIALTKINKLKQYVKVQMAADLDNLAQGKDMKNTLTGSSYAKRDSQITKQPPNVKIELSDDSDCEFVSVIDNSAECVSLVENSEHQDLGSKNVESGLNESSNQGDNQSEISFGSFSEKNTAGYQVYFTVVSKDVTKDDISKALAQEDFTDFTIYVKNKEFHSFGFIKFSSEEAALRAVKLSFQISACGRPMKILPYKKKGIVDSQTQETTPEDNSPWSQAIKNVTNSSFINNTPSFAIEENYLINISCNSKRNRLIDPASDEYTLRFRDDLGHDESNNPSIPSSQAKLLPKLPRPDAQVGAAVGTYNNPAFNGGNSDLHFCDNEANSFAPQVEVLENMFQKRQTSNPNNFHQFSFSGDAGRPSGSQGFYQEGPPHNYLGSGNSNFYPNQSNITEDAETTCQGVKKRYRKYIPANKDQPNSFHSQKITKKNYYNNKFNKYNRSHQPLKNGKKKI